MDFDFSERCVTCGKVRAPDGWCAGCPTPSLIQDEIRSTPTRRFMYYRESRRERIIERLAWTFLVVIVIPAVMAYIGYVFALVFYLAIFMPWALRDIWRRTPRVSVRTRAGRYGQHHV